jgi:2-keto-3-deoxy-L-fuconate dehydrogenase
VLIANLAFSYYRGGVLELSDSEIERTFCRLVYPLHRLIRAVLPQMLARQHGKIVVVGSASALRGRAGISLYAAARGAQHAYVCNVAVESAPHVQINSVGQTFVENPSYFPDPTSNRRVQTAHRTSPRGAARNWPGISQLVLFLAGSESVFFFGQVISFFMGMDLNLPRRFIPKSD